jgi:glyoxylase-like metal-dependent hydrolase (beta-lactamase superfamily II)
MKLLPINAGRFQSDGGALFSVIPKGLWQKVYPSNSFNIVNLTLRCLLVETGNKIILIETGVGSHYSEKYMRNHGLQAGNHLEDSLKLNGYSTSDITDVFFTHLHWDHFNGAVKSDGSKLSLVFSNATYWCSKIQWEHSRISNVREKAAYYYKLLDFVMETGQLKLVEKEGALFENIDVRFFDGHTPGQMIPFINYRGKTLVYMSDLIPTAANIPIVWLASYDLFPVTAMEEKERFLNDAVKNNFILFFEHDYYTECVTVEKNEKGFKLKDKIDLQSI